MIPCSSLYCPRISRGQVVRVEEVDGELAVDRDVVVDPEAHQTADAQPGPEHRPAVSLKRMRADVRDQLEQAPRGARRRLYVTGRRESGRRIGARRRVVTGRRVVAGRRVVTGRR